MGNLPALRTLVEPRRLRRRLGRRTTLLDGLVGGALAAARSVQAAAQATPAPMHVSELTVERLNVVEADGTVRLVLANAARLPAPVVDGEELGPRQVLLGSAGMIFDNQRGDECGGLLYAGSGDATDYAAAGGLFFEQFRQDQTIGIGYLDEDGRRGSSLAIWERPTTPLTEDAASFTTAIGTPDVEDAEALAQFATAVPSPGAAATATPAAQSAPLRIVLGRRPEGNAELLLHDPEGRARLRLTVAVDGAPSIEFLDAEGTITHRFPDDVSPAGA